jgi:hypothetical protein
VEELSGMKLRLVGLVADEFSAEERDADGSIEDRR